jgi:predicted amidohydrolase YtcJ
MSERIFRARRVVTLAGTEPEAFAVLGDRVIATGDLDELRVRLPRAEIVDLEGALVVPGFNDAHCHPSVTAETRLRLDVSPDAAGDLAEVRRLLAERAARTPDGDWIFASGTTLRGPRRIRSWTARPSTGSPRGIPSRWCCSTGTSPW